MATKRSQQIGIWIIAIVLTAGTIGSFMMIVLANENQKNSQSDYEKQIEAYQEEMEKQARDNAENSEPLEGYKATAFDSENGDLKIEVLKKGTGETIKETDTVKVSYFGWTSDGKIFDSSNKKDAEDSPATLPLNGVIKGWTEGLAGQKEGAVVKLTIPADQAYGSSGSGVIPANAPLQFIVIIHSIEPEAEA